MADINVIIGEQASIGKQLDRLRRNYGKAGRERKERPGYHQFKLEMLEEIFWEFQDNHQELETAIPEQDRQKHPYFSDDFHQEIQSVYQKLKDKILAGIQAAGHSASTSINEPRQTDGIKGLLNLQALTMRRLQTNLERAQASIKQGQDQQHFQVMLDAVAANWNQVFQHDEDIWKATAGATPEGYLYDEFLAMEQQVQETIASLSKQLVPDSKGQQAVSNVRTKIELPKLSLPKFDGDYLKWQEFQDLFEQMVDSAPLGRAQKMWFLKDSLVGEAARMVKHLTASDANYDAAWEAVKSRYTNERKIMTSLLDKLLNQKPCRSEAADTLKELYDVTQECLYGLQSLKIDVTSWDPIIVYLLIKKLDRKVQLMFEQSLPDPRNIPTLLDFLNFIEVQFQALEAVSSKAQGTQNTFQKNKAASLVTNQGAGTKACPMCKTNHPIYYCEKFLKLNPKQRWKEAKMAKLCVKCLQRNHSVESCGYKNCPKCTQKHNKLLHFEATTATTAPSGESAENLASEGSSNRPAMNDNSRSTVAAASLKARKNSYVLLATAIVQVTDKHGKLIDCTALLDSGSQLNLISKQFAARLGLNSMPHQLCISGIGENESQAQRRLVTSIQSKTSGYKTNLEAFIIPKIAVDQPSTLINIDQWTIPGNIRLADPNFNKPKRIDLLLGAEIYPEILSIGQVRLAKELPLLQNTLLGWIITGKMSIQNNSDSFCGIACESARLDEQLERFWKMEDVGTTAKVRSAAEAKCEEIFNTTTKRAEDGRFIVQLPFKIAAHQLGDSKALAYRRFLNLEKRLSKNPELHNQYSAFLKEYLQLGHMEEIQEADIKHPHYFLPHHCVIKPESTTTKLRVVFDASAKTTNNLSLNDILLVGPTIQDDLFSILIRFRQHTYVFTADIAKMYRQIMVADENQNLQLIIWRENGKVRYYRLKTVTYGTSPASYLSTRCLHKLAEEEADHYPLASAVTEEDFYVDDLITGTNDEEQAIELQSQLLAMLPKGGFHLRKWCANASSLLDRIPPEDRELDFEFSDAGGKNTIKTLGLTWRPHTDDFFIKSTFSTPSRTTKRTVASDIAHLFDPLGLLGPVIIKAKIFMQHLWELKLDWDAALPQELHTKWTSFRQKWPELNHLAIPRHILPKQKAKNIQLHGFSDASERAYGACVYIRAIDQSGNIVRNLLCAKSRVAPVSRQTIARLELCGAKLLTELVEKVRKALRLNFDEIHFWTDSSIVLSWINSPSSTMKTFVGNRISAIQSLSTKEQWHHVDTKNNPADLISRGLDPEALVNSTLWWKGPDFLNFNADAWPAQHNINLNFDEERRQPKLVLLTTDDIPHLYEVLNHRNSFKTLQRVTAFILRFIKNCRTDKSRRKLTKNPDAEELQDATTQVVKYVQEKDFQSEIRSLKSRKFVLLTSKIAAFVPFLDNEGVLRVGGRLQASLLSYDAKHPMLLSHSHPFTKLLLTQLHKDLKHIGPQGLLAAARHKFWPLHGKAMAQAVCKQCIYCARTRPRQGAQLMGNLPAERIQPSRPFTITGVDFCGPIQIHYKLRGKRPTKSYIAVFVCYATKAVHLEVVSDLTSNAFLDALRRFSARRGNPSEIRSDNATNFVGCRNQLEDLHEMLLLQSSQDKIQNLCAERGIKWLTIPARSPHVGGLWEAAVKSAKKHIKTVISGQSLTFEQLATVAAECEAILNSRPLTPLSDDPNDLQALTPSTIWNQEPLIAASDPKAKPDNLNLVARWTLASTFQREFWERWSQDYLQELQRRPKWRHASGNLREGMLVLLKDDNLPPFEWRMGRIIRLRKGDDGLVRIVDIKTSSGETQRAIHRICPLPVESPTDVPQDPEPVDKAGHSQQEPPKKVIKFSPINDRWTQGHNQEFPGIKP